MREGRGKVKKLRIKINEKLKGYSGNWSVYVKDLKTGDVLSINETSMYPASVNQALCDGGCLCRCCREKNQS